MPTNPIDDILSREGGLVNLTSDHGGRTIYGISEKANPEAWKNGPPSLDTAKQILAAKYIRAPGFDSIDNPYLRDQLIDFGVNSGPQLAIMKLQGLLGLDQDGVIGAVTRNAIQQHPDQRHLHNLLVGERVKMLGRIVLKNSTQLAFLSGWLERATSFIL